jgi:hypothetical protein
MEAKAEINAIDQPTKSRCYVEKLQLENPFAAEKEKQEKILPATPSEGTHASHIYQLPQIEL